jgi:hypothetical protein
MVQLVGSGGTGGGGAGATISWFRNKQEQLILVEVVVQHAGTVLFVAAGGSGIVVVRYKFQ